MELAQFDRLARDEAEVEGLAPTAAGGALPLPTLPVAMLALAVPLLLSILSSLLRRKRTAHRTQHAAPGPRGRCAPWPFPSVLAVPPSPAALRIALRSRTIVPWLPNSVVQLINSQCPFLPSLQVLSSPRHTNSPGCAGRRCRSTPAAPPRRGGPPSCGTAAQPSCRRAANCDGRGRQPPAAASQHAADCQARSAGAASRHGSPVHA